jgi:hypothetical protein
MYVIFVKDVINRSKRYMSCYLDTTLELLCKFYDLVCERISSVEI